MKRFILLCSAALLLLLLAAPPTLAAPTGACYITPTPGAIAAALANPYCLIINLAAGIYKEYDLVVNRDAVIEGAGKTTTIVDGQLKGRVFDLTNSGATVEMSRMTIRNGLTAAYGGGIHSVSRLFVSDMIFVNNRANCGGAIESQGPVTSIRRSAFRNNIADWAGGGVANSTGAITIENSQFDGNQAKALGGAVAGGGFSDVPLDISRTTFSNNRATDITTLRGEGGAIWIWRPATIERSIFRTNTAVGSGGAISLEENHALDIRYSTFTGNKAATYGGAIYQPAGTVDIYASTISSNIAPLGGGVGSTGGSSLNVTYSTLNLNKAAVTVLGAPTQPVPMEGSDAFGHPSQPLPAPRAALGGGPAGGGVFTMIQSKFLNSTLSGNTTTGVGGGIYVSNPGSAVLSFVTLSGNRATADGGNVYNAAANVGFKSSIVNAGLPRNCAAVAGSGWGSAGGSISSDWSCTILIGGLDKSGANPKLGLLASNGGPTKTHALLLGSPAINYAPDCQDWSSTLITLDQRLMLRPKPLGGKCDSGALEK